MKILAVCTGRAERLPEKSYKTGIFKHPVDAAVMVDREGLIGDAICNRKHHGGPDQAVYCMGSADLDWWSQELGRRIEPGIFGENLVIEAVDSRRIAVGDRFETESVTLEVSSARIPCATLAARMGDRAFPQLFLKAGRPGFYCRVLREGALQVGDAITYHAFDGAPVTMPELLKSFGRNLSDADRDRYLAAPINQKLRAMLTG
ncbi:MULTISPECIES: MOSC domain-containing protein [unclassified Rhizobium]|uniref:MOSC domain-containing protein n=1 Tax=unclassified Rhizobium TaxID=2613769 RepID=UPI0006F938C9|nr:MULTISPECIES: MOSC domain-containing protein [unclassified Rhizobium]KQV44367.1 molybdenum cofactor biosysynthesis protein [Rhizobium sp. Root1212]KRD38548.1 molybdenum cofactor biosysynthesis protein [Rhizobium sp. Root268]